MASLTLRAVAAVAREIWSMGFAVVGVAGWRSQACSLLGLLLLCLTVVGMRWAKGSVVDAGHKSGSVHPGAGAVLGSSWH